MEYTLAILFFFVATLYSSVGLGGGSSYTALMAISAVTYQLIPTTSLTLNLIVTFIGTINFWRSGHGRLGLIGPFLITSIPMAYMAGSLQLSQGVFHSLLLGTLVLVALRIYALDELKLSVELSGTPKWIVILLLGATLGFVAGSVGIGGGIYLVPLIVMFGLGNEKEAAAAGTLFIWVNSFFGLMARSQTHAIDMDFILPLAGAVVLGGFLGSYVGAFKLPAKTIQKVMGIAILLAIVFLAQKVT